MAPDNSDGRIMLCIFQAEHNLHEGRLKVRLPKIGETITTDWAIELCRHYRLDHLVQRLDDNREHYKCWKFDGISCLPDRLAACIVGVDRESLTYDCALPHDLCYAYGEPGNEMEKMQVDARFHSDLINKAGMKPLWAKIFYCAVRYGGSEELGCSFSWSFARKDR